MKRDTFFFSSSKEQTDLVQLHSCNSVSASTRVVFLEGKMHYLTKVLIIPP